MLGERLHGVKRGEIIGEVQVVERGRSGLDQYQPRSKGRASRK